MDADTRDSCTSKIFAKNESLRRFTSRLSPRTAGRVGVLAAVGSPFATSVGATRAVALAAVAPVPAAGLRVVQPDFAPIPAEIIG